MEPGDILKFRWPDMELPRRKSVRSPNCAVVWNQNFLHARLLTTRASSAAKPAQSTFNAVSDRRQGHRSFCWWTSPAGSKGQIGCPDTHLHHNGSRGSRRQPGGHASAFRPELSKFRVARHRFAHNIGHQGPAAPGRGDGQCRDVVRGACPNRQTWSGGTIRAQL